MSPLVDGKVVRDRDGYTLDEQGRKTMAHLLALMAMILAFVVVAAGIVLAFMSFDSGATLVLAAIPLAASAAGLDAIQTRAEARREAAGGT